MIKLANHVPQIVSSFCSHNNRWLWKSRQIFYFNFCYCCKKLKQNQSINLCAFVGGKIHHLFWARLVLLALWAICTWIVKTWELSLSLVEVFDSVELKRVVQYVWVFTSETNSVFTFIWNSFCFALGMQIDGKVFPQKNLFVRGRVG